MLTAEVGEAPYIALVLALSFGLYGAVKKVVDPIRGSASQSRRCGRCRSRSGS